MKRIILIDDSEDTFVLVRAALGEGFDLTWAPTARGAEALMKTQSFDLILLDVQLPDGDGFHMCAQFQQNEKTKHIPIIFITGKTGVANLATGLSLGADDYIEKPFAPLELFARVQAKMKRLTQQNESEVVLFRGNLQIHVSNQTVFLNEDKSETKLTLTPIEFKLLYFLARHEDRTYDRDQLMTAVWGADISVADRTIDKHISALRIKLGPCSSYVETVPGFGYKFTSPVLQKAGLQKAG